MLNPCIELCYQKYGKSYTPECDERCSYAKALQEKKLLEAEMNRPISTLSELATQFCCLTECNNCPVTICKYEKRSEYEKTSLHEPCVSNLYKWIIEQAMKQAKSHRRISWSNFLSEETELKCESLDDARLVFRVCQEAGIDCTHLKPEDYVRYPFWYIKFGELVMTQYTCEEYKIVCSCSVQDYIGDHKTW